MSTEILKQVTGVVSEKLGVSPEDVVLGASFEQDLGADSLDLVELVMELEKMFDISIPDDEVEKLQTVGDAVAFIEKNKK